MAEYIYITGCALAFFYFILLITKKNKSTADDILAIWFMIIGINELIAIFVSNNLQGALLIYTRLHIVLPFIHFPFLFLYIKSLIYNTFSKYNYFHFIPLFIWLFIHFFLIPESTYQNYQSFLQFTITKPPLILHLNLIFNLTVGLIYLPVSIFKLKQYHNNILLNYSNIEKINLKWLWHLIYGIVFVWLSGFIFVLLVKWFAFQLPFDFNMFLFSTLTIFVIFIGFYGFRQTTVFHLNIINEGQKKNKISSYNQVYGLKNEDAEKYLRLLLDYMDKEKPFLNNELTLSELAGAIGIYKHYLTQILNDKLNKNFYEFVNHYRVEEFKSQLNNPKSKKFSFLGLALNSGFNSKSSFNRIFKDLTGLTPSQYKNLTKV